MKNFLIAATVLLPLLGCEGQISGPISGIGPGTSGGGAAIDTAGAGGGGLGAAGGSNGSSSGSSGGTSPGGTAGSSSTIGANSSPNNGGAGAQAATSDGGAADFVAPVGAALLGLPCDIQILLANRCQTCHGSTPALGTPSSLVTYQNLTGPSKLDPTKTEAVMAVSRMQNTTLPMPPAPGTRVTAAEVGAIQAWIAAGYPSGSCAVPSDGGVAGDAGGADGGVSDGGPVNDPLLVPATCTSKTNWTSGNRGSGSMNPGMACINCHARGEGPRFSIAGTVYPTAHEPDRCNGANGNTGARVVITGADGKAITLTPNAAGNFSSNATVAKPYRAKVTYMGRERLMIAAQTSGDCNSCHTQMGATMAPGRLLLP